MARVTIVPYDPAWPTEFRDVAARLRVALGEHAVRIDHIGSTSVPGLPAKNILDVQVSVIDLDAELLAPLFEQAGFTLVPEGTEDHQPPGFVGADDQWRKLYFGPSSGRAIHLHTRAAGRANQRYALLFRDYLRAHTGAAAAYAEVKLRLAALGIDSLIYADVKDPVCDLIIQATEAWATRTDWQLGPSDA